MQQGNRTRLTSGKVESLLLRLTIPMIFGMVGMVVFNLVDTYFVGRLGTDQLAALTFTFPVVLVINSLALGLGIGASSVISKAVGEGDNHRVQRLATDSLILSILLVIVFVTIGILTIEPVFKLLGVSSEIMPYVKEYMRIWYFGVVFVVVPMVGNNTIRALGDTKTPGIIMMISAGINLVLDPVLIYGLGPFPKLGIGGAAIATVIARALTFLTAAYVLIIREKVVTFEKARLSEVMDSWKQILFIGLPNALTRMVIPIAAGVITSLISSYGTKAVAGFGVATRIEFFALALVNALSSVMGPFVGQNWGAREFERVKRSIRFSEKISVIFNFVLFLLLAIFASQIGGIFNKDTEVIKNISIYLRIVPIGYGLQGIILISSSVLNVFKKPLHAALLTIIQMFIIYIPLAFIGSRIFGITGIFGALTISNILTGMIAHKILSIVLKNVLRIEPEM
ncbi:MATE family efflux transporter [Wukongibacter sp. M2B1]|uniref:MATE family efflux transporter n=1 Tax=Wukongibacter sp. M2B1 TaxID=3088895 RepID=UPI003D7ACECE